MANLKNWVMAVAWVALFGTGFAWASEPKLRREERLPRASELHPTAVVGHTYLLNTEIRVQNAACDKLFERFAEQYSIDAVKGEYYARLMFCEDGTAETPSILSVDFMIEPSSSDSIATVEGVVAAWQDSQFAGAVIHFKRVAEVKVSLGVFALHVHDEDADVIFNSEAPMKQSFQSVSEVSDLQGEDAPAFNPYNALAFLGAVEARAGAEFRSSIEPDLTRANRVMVFYFSKFITEDGDEVPSAVVFANTASCESSPSGTCGL